jgi:hypothetical protein
MSTFARERSCAVHLSISSWRRLDLSSVRISSFDLELTLDEGADFVQRQLRALQRCIELLCSITGIVSNETTSCCAANAAAREMGADTPFRARTATRRLRRT